MLQNLPNFWNHKVKIGRGFSVLNFGQFWDALWVYGDIKNFWCDSLDNSIKYKPPISEECCKDPFENFCGMSFVLILHKCIIQAAFDVYLYTSYKYAE